nr:hypothetical protein CFP56_37215 [Quercus suber]
MRLVEWLLTRICDNSSTWSVLLVVDCAVVLHLHCSIGLSRLLLCDVVVMLQTCAGTPKASSICLRLFDRPDRKTAAILQQHKS